MVEITVSANSRTHQNVTQQAFSTGAIERNGLVADQPVIWNRGGNYFYQFKDPLDYDSVHEFNDAELEKKLREEEELKSTQPPPTTADPHPPELVPDDGETFAIATSPDVCRSPEKPIPYMAWGKADDKTNYSPNVRSNGLVIKRQDSKFFRCYGDEPGVGKGVKSGTVEDVVEPVSSSAIVRANGIPVQRHADKCTLNNGNCPGEYVHVKSTEVHSPPDGNDEQNRGGFGRAWDGFYNNSDEAQLAGGALKKGEEYWNDPSRIGSDLQSAWDSRPSVDDVTSFGKNVGQGVANTADYVWNNPGQSAENVATWTGDALKGLWTGVTDAYDKGGVPQAGGHLAAVAVGVINPFRKAKTAGEAIEALEDVTKAERRAKEAEEAARKAREAKKAEEEAAKATENGDGGTRSTRRGVRNPCLHLAKGDASGTGPYRGGSYGGTKGVGALDMESNHMPPKSVSPLGELPSPSMQMDKIDHRKAMSTGSSFEAQEWRELQQELISEGRYRDALAMDIRDVRRLAAENGDLRKYNEGVRELLKYYKCLVANGWLPGK
ncbi:DUF4150 domain-containing protein [Rhizobium sp. Leaf311]|uniref:DUF4150 domain-containing protein n=1 Tax=Rhizobium sp. Leaf311 TaxID=1736332 RepID=UPI000789A571|nr:DUF4150 domain-containing protein [Rhizobium sp. Leaf311]